MNFCKLQQDRRNNKIFERFFKRVGRRVVPPPFNLREGVQLKINISRRAPSDELSDWLRCLTLPLHSTLPPTPYHQQKADFLY